MKKISKILLVLLMLMAAAFTAMACNTKTVDSISVKSEDMPRKTVYIIGSDTEFSPFGGSLTVRYSDGSEETVSLENEKVSFSGFDPNKVGSQKITVKYEDKTCEITIRVIKRFTLVDVETDYFVGEELDRSGKLVLTKDDGTTQEIAFNDPTVTISGAENFSASEGDKELTISHGEYTDKLQLKVYKVAKATPAFGSSIYMSHKDQLDLSSARLTLQNQASVDNKADGAVRKEINLTRELLKSCGVNDEQIFNEARQELLAKIDGEMQGGDYSSEKYVTKDIEFNYAGQQLKFTISIYLSRQSYIMYYADKYADINYQGELQKDENGKPMLDENGNEIREIELTADQENVDKVTYVAKMYFDLETDKEKSEVEVEKRDALLKLAGYHWYHKWLNVITTGELAKTFNLNYSPYTGASLTLNVGDGYDGALKTLALLKEENTLKEFNAVNNDLWLILGNEELANLVVYTIPGEGEDAKDINVTLKAFLQLAVPQDQVELLVAQLENAIELYGMLKDVKLSDVEDYNAITDAVKADVINTYKAIVDENNQFRGNRPHFALIKEWNNEYFDILYQYYWNITQQDPQVIGTDAWTNAWNALVLLASNAILPCDELENFYSTAVQLLELMNLLNNGYSYDATELYFYYNLLNEYAEKLDNIDNDLYKGLYEQCGYSFPIISQEANNFVTIEYAMNRIDKLMVTFLGLSQDIPEIKEYFDFYISMYEKAEKSTENKYVTINEYGESEFTQEYKDDVTKLINDFFAMSPTNQFMFMNTISAYDIRLLNIKSYTSADGVPTAFTGFISSYYNNILSEDALEVCDDLFFAYECYIRREAKSDVTSFDSFFEYYVRYGKPNYIKLDEDEKELIKVVYDETTRIYELYDANQSFIPMEISSIENEEWEKKFTELYSAVKDFYMAYSIASGGLPTNLPFICAFLKVENIYNEFVAALESETDEAVKAKVSELLEHGEFDIVSFTLNGQNIHYDGNIEYYLKTAWGSFLNYAINEQFNISGNAITTSDLFNEKLNPGFKQMFKDMADFIVQAQYYLVDDNIAIDFGDMEKAGEVFRKFFAAPEEKYTEGKGYTLDQKNIVTYLDSLVAKYVNDPNSQKYMPFTASAVYYYASVIRELDNLTAAQKTSLSSAVVNYINVVEGYMEYYYLLYYNEATLSPEDKIEFDKSLIEMEAAYDKIATEFRDMYQSMPNVEKVEFDKFFDEASRNFFTEKPVKVVEE